MDSLNIEHVVTVLAGRPSTGKTSLAIETCRKYLADGWKVIYYHAEGSADSQPTSYGVETPEQLLQFQLVLDLNFDLRGLAERIERPSENSSQASTLVVIDTIDLFDCDREELLSFIESVRLKANLHFLLLTYIPRSFERKHKDQAEQFIRNAHSFTIDQEVIVLGNFPKELFEKVQKQIAVNDSARANLNRRGSKIYLLTGILHHQNGATYSGQSAICRNGRRKNYYYESKTKSRIDADQLEDKILKSLSSSIEQEVELEKHIRSVSDSRNKKVEIVNAEMKRQRQEVGENEKKELDLVKGLSALGGNASATTLRWLDDQVKAVERVKSHCGERLAELEREKEHLLKAEVNLKKYQDQALGIFRKMKKAAPVRQRQFLRQVLEKVEISPSGEIRIDWKFSGVFTAMEETVASGQNWLKI